MPSKKPKRAGEGRDELLQGSLGEADETGEDQACQASAASEEEVTRFR